MNSYKTPQDFTSGDMWNGFSQRPNVPQGWSDELGFEFDSKYDGTTHYPSGKRAWSNTHKQLEYPNVNSYKTPQDVTSADMWNGYL